MPGNDILPHNEIAQILERVKSDAPLLLFSLLSLSTGDRLESLRAIMVKDVNLQARTTNLVDYKAKSSGKGKVPYTGYISKQLQGILNQVIPGKSPQ